MKRFFLILFLVGAIAALLLVSVSGQQSSLGIGGDSNISGTAGTITRTDQAQAPVTYRLNPEASERWKQLDKLEQDIIKDAQQKLNEVATHKLELIMSVVPPGERDRKATEEAGIIVFRPKEVAKEGSKPKTP